MNDLATIEAQTADAQQQAARRAKIREARGARRRAREQYIGEVAAAVGHKAAIAAAGVCGAGLIAYGAWCIYHPAGLVVGGTLLLTEAILDAHG